MCWCLFQSIDVARQHRPCCCRRVGTSWPSCWCFLSGRVCSNHRPTSGQHFNHSLKSIKPRTLQRCREYEDYRLAGSFRRLVEYGLIWSPCLHRLLAVFWNATRSFPVPSAMVGLGWFIWDPAWVHCEFPSGLL